MLRLTDVRLPLDHDEAALKHAIAKELGLSPDGADGSGAHWRYEVFRRAIDARKKSAIVFNYTVDIALDDETSLLARVPKNPHWGPKPDIEYRFVAQAPTAGFARPVVIGAGP